MAKALAIALAAVLCIAGGASADVPVLMSYQGVLTNAAGVVVPDGPYDVTFRIYDVPFGGSALWTETELVQVNKGIFSAILGQFSDLGSIGFDMDYYLGISIAGGEELPRTMLTSSPYSFASRAVIGLNNIFPSNGNVGIGTKYPSEKLEVSGGIRLGSTYSATAGTMRWTGSDFEGYDGATWKSLTATGGSSLPAGTFGQTLRYNGSAWTAAGNLYNNGTSVGIGTTSPAATLHVNGGVNIGSMAADGSLNMYRSGVSTSILYAAAGSNGGGVYSYDNAGNMAWGIESNPVGTGGMLSFMRGAGQYGFIVDSNNSGSGNAVMEIFGNSSAAVFDMNYGGNSSVMLPAGAISSSEMFDEPGVASYVASGGVALTTSLASYASRTVTVPADGYVLVMATADLNPRHVAGAATTIVIGVSAEPNSLPTSQNSWLQLDPSTPSGLYYYPVTVSGIFQVAAGANTLYLVAQMISGTGWVYERNLSIVYVPTAYGTFVSPLTSANGESSKQPGGSAITSAEIAAERAASEAAVAERVQRELDAMKEQMARFKEEIENLRDRRAGSDR